MLEEELQSPPPPPPRHSQLLLLGAQVVSTSCLEVRRTMRMTATPSSRLSMPEAAQTPVTW